MNDILGKSKIRQSILKLLFSNQEKEFYLSEIARIINASRGNAQKELKKLEETGIIKSEKRNNLRYYFLNKQNPLFTEWEGMVKKTVGIENELKNIIQKISEIEYAFIFGSYAKNDFKSESDIDLFIIGNPSEDELIKQINKLEKEINREINYHIYSEKEFKEKIKTNSFLKNIIKKYIMLTPNEKKFRKIFR
ncbi:MAG TPA: hypothetical protein DCS28_02030 [Candidatus Moranbacteria bacterium]|nr:hypothetical protein [Candidatus Moranbacteria bacterium]HAT74796.1 hypothetical protein [Candidatus Moranbacteria bacterium]